MFDILKSNTKDMYLAGDDDQAIYAWAGADVDRFIQEPATEVVLKNQEEFLYRYKTYLILLLVE